MQSVLHVVNRDSCNRTVTCEMRLISGHYSDIHSIVGGRVGGRRAVQSITNDDGHYSDIHGIIPRRPSVRSRASGYEHYVDIDRIRIIANSGDGDHPQSGDQAARSQDYEGRDPSDLATLHQPQRPHDYVGLGAEEAAASTQQTTETTEDIEMTERGYQNTVSVLYVAFMFVRVNSLCVRRFAFSRNIQSLLSYEATVHLEACHAETVSFTKQTSHVPSRTWPHLRGASMKKSSGLGLGPKSLDFVLALR